MTTQPIMVQMRDRKWTISALHLACAMARNGGRDVVLMRMQQVQHIAWLGTEIGYESPSLEERCDLDEYAATAQDYGVKLNGNTFQYTTLPEALIQAAEHINAGIVFATLPNYSLPYWRQFQMWRFERQLKKQNCQLYTLEKVIDTPAQTPYILVPASSGKRIRL